MARHGRRVSGNQTGVTLFEIIVAVGILAMLAGAIAPSMIETMNRGKYRKAAAELSALQNAVYGSGGEDFGFLGDIGRLPGAATLSRDLVSNQPATLSRWRVGFGGVLVGWKGPYISHTTPGNDPFLDPWGRPYELLTSGLDGGRFVSRGRNGIVDGVSSGSDDLFAPGVRLPASFPYGKVVVRVQAYSPLAPNALLTLGANQAQIRIHVPRFGVSENGTSSLDANGLAGFEAVGPDAIEFRNLPAGTAFDATNGVFFARGGPLNSELYYSRGLHAVEVEGLAAFSGRVGTGVARLHAAGTSVTVLIQ